MRRVALRLFALAVVCATLASRAQLAGAQQVEDSDTEVATGVLVGHVDIGPLTPVERVGVPSPTPAPAVCTARGLVVLAADTQQEVTRLSFEPDCTCSADLPPGQYVVQLQARGIDHARDLPQTMSIDAGQVTTLDLNIDTGIR